MQRRVLLAMELDEGVVNNSRQHIHRFAVVL